MVYFNLASLRLTTASISTPICLSIKIPSKIKLATGPPLNSRRALHRSTNAKNTRSEQDPLVRPHLSSFFAQYPNFKYDPSKPFMDEFWRLVNTNGYGRHGKRYKSARKGVKDAMVREFQDVYGVRPHKLHVWHKFFQAIGINEEPRDLDLCYKRAKAINLNICDLIDQTVTGIAVKDFPTVKELSSYTFQDSVRPKIAPPISKKEDPIVARLFRNLTNPPKPKDEVPFPAIKVESISATAKK